MEDIIKNIIDKYSSLYIVGLLLICKLYYNYITKVYYNI